jgi:putative ABC transport system permease protein
VANVSGLLLARASARTAELAIRSSLGASRGRIVRQLLAESLLLVLGATLSGLLITLLLTPVLTKLFEGKLLLQPDWRLLCYSIAMAAVATLVCGIMPALRSSRSGLSSALKKGSRHNRWTLRGALVVGQLAVSVVLLCAGLLFLRNLQHASSMNPGFDVAHTVRANMHLIPESYSQPKRRILIDTALERIRATPGIEGASVAAMVPLAGNLISQEDWTTDVNAEAVHLDARVNDVSTDYFRTMQIPILQGREFLPSDGEGAPRVVILNQSMARRLFGTSNPVGHVIRWKSGQPFLVAGLARDSKYSSLGEKNIKAYYQSYSQIAGSPSTLTTDQSDLHFLIRASGSAGTAVAPANKVLSQLDPSAALDIKPMRENLRSAMAPSQVGARLDGIARTISGIGGTLRSAAVRCQPAHAGNRSARRSGYDARQRSAPGRERKRETGRCRNRDRTGPGRVRGPAACDVPHRGRASGRRYQLRRSRGYSLPCGGAGDHLPHPARASGAPDDCAAS